MEHERLNFVSFSTNFWPFSPLTTQKIKIKKKMKKKTPRGYTISHKCTINYHHMMYGSWDMKHDRHNFLSFWDIFCPFTPPTTQKIKIWNKWKKHWEISFYTLVSQMTIIRYMIPEIWSITDIFFCHFGLFFALLPP